MSDPYVYSGTSILKNKFDINDQDTLNQMERLYSTSRIGELKESPIQGNFDIKHLQKIHNHIFQDIYEWAGKIRTVDIAKSTLFCSVRNLDSYQQAVFNDLKKENYLKGLDIDQFSNRAAHYLGEINMVHPFREGNGRTQREFMRELAQNAGYELNLDQVSKEKMLAASIQSANVSNDGLRAIIRENIKPLELVNQTTIREFEQAKSTKELPKNPHSKTLFAAYAKETLAESGQVWTSKTNRHIVERMLKNGVSEQRTRDALQHSPEKVKNACTFVKEIKKELEKIPEIKAILQKSRGLTR